MDRVATDLRYRQRSTATNIVTMSSSNRVIVVGGRNRRPWAVASKERLLEAATKEIASVGFERAKISAIAKRADMASGSVYTWFENKEDLFSAVLEQALRTQILSNQAALENLEASPSWMLQVAALVPRNHEDSGATDAQMLLIESYYAAWRDEKVREQLLTNITSHLSMYENIVIEAQRDGQIPVDIDASAFAKILLAVPAGLSLLNLAGVPRIPDKSWLSIVTRLVGAFRS